ncbi:hypothetical protein [Actinocrispum wychmicini]|uniref:Uncharacterized protein n=1 Tax=Actinocrispum wychmicini TaxID=1213861 RepID=A0A4R2IRS9_9PSEU|nr:hypothetical protein [Actinocrispum wychmicini]TCO47993.1 hypothetical protein EV192_11646 [Actinocrispum wychmicini]
MGKWVITDGDMPGEGEPIGFAQSLPTGLIHLKMDGYVKPKAAQVARMQIMAAINDVTPSDRPT